MVTMLALNLTACGGPTGVIPRAPRSRVADDIEAKLAKVPCVGQIDRWERHYSFASKLGSRRFREYDYRHVLIAFYQAGFEEFRSRRVFHHGAEPVRLDDRAYNLVFGDYDIPTHTVSIWTCGPNVGGNADVHIVIH
jgi:hypothetical protein